METVSSTPASMPRCPRCGTSLDDPPPPDQTCPTCGRSITPKQEATPLDKAGTRRRRVLALAGVGLAALGMIGLGIAAARAGLLFPGDTPQPGVSSVPGQASAKPQPTIPAPETTVLSQLTITTAESAGKGNEPRVIVTLQRPGYHDPVPQGFTEPLFGHELVRQTVLAAARDLGAVVRDASIGDDAPTGQVVMEAELGVCFPREAPATVTIWRRTHDQREHISTINVTTSPLLKLTDGELLAALEATTRETVPEVLESIGLKRRPAVARRAGPLPPEVTDRLGQVSFTEPYVAARLVQTQILAEGATPERLGALARAFANLGMLSEFHWNTANKAFKARALLTAQRMIVDEPQLPGPLWHRAYVYALAGLHGNALEDLAAAEMLTTSQDKDKDKDKVSDDRPQPPSWVPVIDAFCRFQTAKLLAVGEGQGPDRQLAMMLAYFTVEKTTSSSRLRKVGLTVLGEIPECYRVHDAFSRTGGIGNFHTATLAGIKQFSAAVPEHLKTMPGMPAKVMTILKESGSEPTLTRALVDAGRDPSDTSEPSWGTLGRLMREVRFAQILRRAHFMKSEWSVPTEDFVTDMRPLFADHPYRDLIESYGVDWEHAPEKYIDLIKGLQIPDLQMHEYSFVWKMQRIDYARGDQLYQLAFRHVGHLYPDLVGAVSVFPEPALIMTAKWMSEVSPHSPYWRAQLIEHDWAYAEPHAKEWEESAGEHPEILLSLGYQYSRLERWEDAERCLNRALTMAPDIYTYKQLGWTYYARGDVNRWLEALERSLEIEDAGLNHERTRIDIARHYVQRKDYGKALLYATPAAESWAGWAMPWAAFCHEALEHWDEAELWERRQTERYPESSWFNWYHFCKRTGHGDLAKARQVALDHIAGFGDHPTEAARQHTGHFHLIDGSPRKALEIFLVSSKIPKYDSASLLAASLAEELGDTAERDRQLTRLAGQPDTARSPIGPIIKAIHEGIKGEGEKGIDSAVITATLANLPTPQQEHIGILAARFLHAHGAPEEAKSIVRRIVEWPETSSFSRTWGTLCLRSWEKPPAPVTDQPKPNEPAQAEPAPAPVP